MQQKLIKKEITFVVILLFISVSVIPSTRTSVVEKSFTMSFDDNTLYVGGSGPGNYSTIQEAIDNASDGDTVFVYSGWYDVDKWININKSIRLTGEDKENTIINDSGISIVVSEVYVSGFTIQNGSGITITSYSMEVANNNSISGNNFKSHESFYGFGGIIISNSSYNTITNNSLGVSIERFQFQDYVVTAKFEFNNIYENGYNLNSTVSNTIDATYNWWGTSDVESINQTIDDVTLDFTGGTVNFVPFLTEPNTEAMPVPEFPSWIVLPLLMILTLLVVVFKKTLRHSD